MCHLSGLGFHADKEDILEMLGNELGPVRLKYALLSLKVLKVGAYGAQDASEDVSALRAHDHA